MFGVLLLASLMAAREPATAERGAIVARVSCAADPEMTYAYYLPRTYTSSKRWPILLVFDPRGRGAHAAELFRDGAEELGWIVVSSNDTRSDDPKAPNARAVAAMSRDAFARFAVDTRRIYLTGFSGGAVLAWAAAERTRGVAGVIAVGGRVSHPERITGIPFAWYGLTGESDFNYLQMRAVEEKLAATSSAHRLVVFDGGHRWAPPAELHRAMVWMELQAMRRGMRAVDEAWVERLLAREVELAEGESDDLGRLRSFEAIARSFESLAGMAAVRERLASLRDTPIVRKLAREEKKAIEFERAHLARSSRVLATLVASSEVPELPALLRQLEIAAVQRAAREGGYKGQAARRAIEALHVQLAFYLPPQLDDEKRALVAAAAKAIR